MSANHRSGRGAGRSAIVRGFLALTLIGSAVAVGHAPAAYADAAGKGGDFVPLPAPAQLLDTRSGIGATAGLRGPGSITTVQVTGRAGVPATGVSAVLVDTAAVNPTAATYFTLWPDLTSRPGISMLTVKAGVIMSNSAVVPVGSNGKINVFNLAGNTHMAVDVHGYFLSAPSGAAGQGGFVPVPHTRLVDTRSGLGAPRALIAAGASVTVTIGNGAPVPASAAAAFVNLTVVGATRQSWLAAYPAGGSSLISTFDYPLGNSAEGTAVKLGPGGQITVRNAGGAAINLLVDVEGYFSTQPTQGAGLRPILTRLIDTRTAGIPIPANGGTIDVAVGGTNGLPTRDIASAVLNLIAVAPAAAGLLVAWPKGGTAPATSLSNFNAGETRAGVAVVRPGVEGKVTIRNSSPSPVHILVDLQGWLADPLPAVPIAQYARGSATQAAPAGSQLGTLEFAYVNNIGALVHGRANPDAFSSVQWTVISEGQAFSGTPALAQQPDGRMQIATQQIDSNVWARTQSAAGSPDWAAWSRLGGSMAAPPAVSRLPDGRLVQFAVDADGRLWHLPQSGANGAYTSWQSLGDADLVGTPTVVALENTLQLLALDTTGALHTATYFPDGTLSAWTDLGGSGLNGTPAAVVYPGFRLRVFARAADGTIVTKAQDASGAFAADWAPVGDLIAAGSPAALLNPFNGRTEVIARRAGGTILAVRETAQGSGAWGNWVEAPGDGFVAATDPTILTYTSSNGPTYLFVARDADNVQHIWFPPSGALAQAASSPTYLGRKLPAPPR